MPLKTVLWKVGKDPTPLEEASLGKEQLLEDMIATAPGLLSDEWMLIGRQEPTESGGRVDFLGLAPDGSLVLIELKRDRTPRDVVAQALDYATWVEKLRPEDIAAIYARYAPGKDLAAEFSRTFGQALDEETLNQSHQIVVVASRLDDSTERIVGYLNERDIAINVLFFQVFASGGDQILSRTWLLDPVHAQTSGASAAGPREPWNGEFYSSFGDGPTRSWRDAVEFGFICAGGGAWYSRTLQLLSPDDRVWVKVPGAGFVGVGLVAGHAQPASEFKVKIPEGEASIFDVAKRASYRRDRADDLEACEYFVPMRWLDTLPIEKAVQEVGMFGNQNSVCKPTTPAWRLTVERLKERFPNHGRPRG